MSPNPKAKTAMTRQVKIQAAAAQLEANEQEVSERRRSLLEGAGQLREEVFNLKNEVLKHAGCDCPLIQAYLQHAARQVYAGLKGVPQPQPPQPQPPPAPPPQAPPETTKMGVGMMMGR
ncbi:hypothetical protein QBC36DRAFT_305330 [Triangularia setosa]|uniref:Uncharacterized protein n=1 Tax=Triangularia setosa TaxID=2587417 RepID=A0AAN7A2W7_9PEZI|nr:hypothetical protein QBC36DRAFT_305330 [Podospora setosa]